MKLQGVYIPLVTPFVNDSIDLISYGRMVNYYIEKGVSGLVPLGTTGESPTIEEYEFESILEKTMEYNNNRVPIYVGIGGNNTKKVIKQLKLAEKYNIDGILSVSPYYNKPDQRGIYEHFSMIANSTGLDIIVYNIPYRTGRNIENKTIYKLAEIKNIIGIKDCCGDVKQSTELLLNRPENFSILTGEDILYYITLIYGGDGGILASANMNTEDFIAVYNSIKSNDHFEALKIWNKLSKIIPLLFEEPNPAPIKYCLNKLGLIESPELRLPLTEITVDLKVKLDRIL